MNGVSLLPLFVQPPRVELASFLSRTGSSPARLAGFLACAWLCDWLALLVCCNGPRFGIVILILGPYALNLCC